MTNKTNEPVIYIKESTRILLKNYSFSEKVIYVSQEKNKCFIHPLYLHPLKELSDEDIREVYGKDWEYKDGDYMRFARALLKKAREG